MFPYFPRVHVFVICSSPNAAGVKSLAFTYNLFNPTCWKRSREDRTLVQYFTASCLFYNTVNNWQVDAGVKLLNCAREIFLGKAGMPRRQRVCRCNVLPSFDCVLMYHKYVVVFLC